MVCGTIQTAKISYITTCDWLEFNNTCLHAYTDPCHATVLIETCDRPSLVTSVLVQSVMECNRLRCLVVICRLGSQRDIYIYTKGMCC